jgi:hypothetical protein
MDEEAPLKWPEDRDKFWETDPEYRDFAAMLEELNAEPIGVWFLSQRHSSMTCSGDC